jgi:type II secretory pathway component PulK
MKNQMHPILSKLKLNQSGAGLIMILVFISLLVILLGLLLTKLENEFASGAVSYHNLQALNLAEAGVDKAISEINRTGGTYTGEENSNLGPGKFTVMVKAAQGI